MRGFRSLSRIVHPSSFSSSFLGGPSSVIIFYSSIVSLNLPQTEN